MNPVYRDMPTTIFEDMSQRARARGAINLGQGFPDGPRPDAVIAAAAAALAEQGLAKGKLRRETAARLHLGMMQLAAGRKDAAKATLSALAGAAAGDPLAEAARLWALWAGTPPMLPPR